MNPTRIRPALPLVALAIALAAGGCDKEEDLEPPIAFSSAPPVASVDLQPDAGAGGEGGAGGQGGAGGGAEKPKAKGPWDPLRIGRCCAALASNREAAPPTQKGAYDIAIVACQQARNNPSAIHRIRQLVPSVPACQ